MNGRLFENLPALDWVDLRDNECISGLFETPEAIATLSRNVTESCAFTDTGETDYVKVVNTECGVIKYGTGYILGGTETKPGQWWGFFFSCEMLFLRLFSYISSAGLS